MIDQNAYEKKLDLIKYYNSITNYEKARVACLDALQENPHDEWVLSILTNVYYNLRDFDACVKTGLEALPYQTPHQQAFIFNILSLERAYKGDYKKAAEYSKKSIEGRPQSVDYIAAHAENLAHLGKRKEALQLFKHAEELNPKNFYLLNIEFQFYHEFFRDKKAEEELLARMVPLSTKPFDMNWNFGIFNKKYKEYYKAEEYFVQALLARPGDRDCEAMINAMDLERKKRRIFMTMLFPGLVILVALYFVLKYF
ncbi:MAG: hypothetical protein LBI03_09190 [Clostridiales bacterium]|nr:hypothetical protein [Clostridiales bacterium]